MARKVIEQLIDDLDGSSAHETISFTFVGASYEIDLSSEHAGELRDLLAPYLGAARQIGGRRSRPASTRASRKKAPTEAPDPKAVREWASQQGIKTSPRGRVSADVVRQYQEAQGR